MAKKTNKISVNRFYRCTLQDGTKKEFYVNDMNDQGEFEVENAHDRAKSTERVKDLSNGNNMEEVDPDEIGMTEPKDVARFLARELFDNKVLDQNRAVTVVQKKFGDAYVVKTGNFALAEKVKRHFRKLYAGWADWNPDAKCWEARKSAYT